jgi:hypothetical protein
VKGSIAKTTAEMDQAPKRLSAIEAEVIQRVDVQGAAQRFKTRLSVAFTVLVGLVIVGFYLLAWKDDVLRREIFSRHSGIQFITLFSLIIAIILFGITGILEGKELSALLGGLSGYILGAPHTLGIAPRYRSNYWQENSFCAMHAHGGVLSRGRSRKHRQLSGRNTRDSENGNSGLGPG